MNLTEAQKAIETILAEVYECGYEEGRCKGYKNRCIEEEFQNTNKYEDGLNDAWEAARKVVEMGEYDRKNVVFVRLDDGEFPFKKYSASEAITRIKEYENRIEVGDEVNTIYDDTPMVVVNIFNEDVTGEKRVVSVSISGIVSTRYVEELEKTGRHFPQIKEVLKQLQEGQEN